MDFYTLVTCAWLACTPMFGYPAHLTKAECEAATKELKEASCLRENNWLIAKKGNAFLCAELGITPQPRIDHAQYLKRWLEIMEADNRAIFSAAARAQEAVAFLHTLIAKSRA